MVVSLTFMSIMMLTALKYSSWMVLLYWLFECNVNVDDAVDDSIDALDDDIMDIDVVINDDVYDDVIMLTWMQFFSCNR